MENLGVLEELTDLRQIWPHEAANFTKWLAKEKNIEMLADAIGIDGIETVEVESSVGDFHVDIYAKGEQGKIIVENQLEDTNHDHLGKIITYAAGKEASIIVWVVKRAREEHRCAIEWLNEHTDESVSFFLVEIKLYKIGDSKPAVKLDVVERPNDWSREVKKQENASPINQERLEYWMEFNEFAFKNVDFSKEFNKTKPSTDHWMDFAVGSSAYKLEVLQVRKNSEISVVWYIVNDKELFKKWHVAKDKIEKDMDMKLDWRELPNKKASRIIISKKVDYNNKDERQEQFKWLMNVMLKMKKAFLNIVNN